MKLVIANKAYSSWSMRPWLALTHAGLPFEEEVIGLRHEDTARRIQEVSPTGKVPVLIDGDLVVHESLAILEYLAERAPHLWPAESHARAVARAVSAEMHASFQPLRQRCPMNFNRQPRAIALSPELEANVTRIVEIWRDCRAAYGQDGPFLFGAFSNADAMFAPVVNRLHVYAIVVPDKARAYMDAMMASPPWRAWERGALAETDRIQEYEQVA